MKQATIALAACLLIALSTGCGAAPAMAEWTGHIVDAQCSKSTAESGNVSAQCAQDCIKGGSPAVLVTEDGKIYEITNQDQVTPHAGLKVVIKGSESGGKITADSVTQAG